jgi:hypothetical protein
MKAKHYLFALLLTLTAIPALSQDWKSYNFSQPYPGYVITNAGDTLKGYVVHGDRTQNQNKVVFYSDINDKKSKKEYKPADLKGYHVGDKEYRTIQYSGGLLKKPLNFILVKTDGKIATYAHYTKQEGFIIQVRKNGETDQEYDERVCEEEVLFRKGDDELIKLSSFLLNFKKNMEKLISDHPALYAKVQNGEKGYGKLNVLDIIKEYNETFPSK